MTGREFLQFMQKLATTPGVVVKDKQQGSNPYPRDMKENISNVGLLGKAKNQEDVLKNVRQHVSGKDNHINSLRQGESGLQDNSGKADAAPKVESDGSLKDNAEGNGSSPSPHPMKAASFEYLESIYEMIKESAPLSAPGMPSPGLGMGGPNALNARQPARLPNPGAEPPTPKQ